MKLGFCPPLSLASVQEQRLPNAASVDAEDTPPITPTTAQHSKVTAPLAPLARSLARSLSFFSLSLSLSLSISISIYFYFYLRDPILLPIFRTDFFFAVRDPYKMHLSSIPENTAPPVAWSVLSSSPRSILVSRLNIHRSSVLLASSPSKKKKKKNRKDIARRWGYVAVIRESLILN